ncbi:Alpha/Beta hydrolase protein [Flammula alnicola]|nr:Alpha/Beta hydrolase protein [Flammula alnicola]
MASSPIPEATGTATFVVDGQSYKTWYKVLGNLKSGKTPLVTIHGGPGLNHQYMLNHKHLWTSQMRPIVLYDQIGNGNSTHLPDAPSDFWTPKLFMDELENLLNHLGISDNFALVGHCWGGMLAAQFAAERQPKGLRKLILISTPASMKLFEQGANDLLEKFPSDFVSMMRKHEDEGTAHSPEYQNGNMQFMKKHVCTLDPWPEDVLGSFMMIAADPTVWMATIGPSEFKTSGSLRDWNIIDILPKITYPILMVSGNPLKDQAQEKALKPWMTSVPNIEWVQLEKGSHMTMYEDQEKYLSVVQKFLGEN